MPNYGILFKGVDNGMQTFYYRNTLFYQNQSETRAALTAKGTNMYITLETDYAIRIVDCLARRKERTGAKIIAENACVTLRFSLKILRKLVASGIVRSYKGTQGGYELARPLPDISVNDILESIEGPYVLNRCVKDCSLCTFRTRPDDSHCPYHYLFEHISHQVQNQLRMVTLDKIVED